MFGCEDKAGCDAVDADTSDFGRGRFAGRTRRGMVIIVVECVPPINIRNRYEQRLRC